MPTGQCKTSPRERLAVAGRERARSRYWDEYDRETHACWMCDNSGIPLEVHHRDEDYLNNELINLIAVCRGCHRAIHHRRATASRLAEWKADFLDIGGESFTKRREVYSDSRQLPDLAVADD